MEKKKKKRRTRLVKGKAPFKVDLIFKNAFL
jgi:hypothetical protein